MSRCCRACSTHQAEARSAVLPRLVVRFGRLSWGLLQILHRLWRAVDQEGLVPEGRVHSHRNTKAAMRSMRKLLRQNGVPRVIVTDRLRSYGAAKGRIMPGVEHRTHKGLNNRAETSRLATRRRERRMKRFKSPGQVHCLVWVHDPNQQPASSRAPRKAIIRISPDAFGRQRDLARNRCVDSCPKPGYLAISGPDVSSLRYPRSCSRAAVVNMSNPCAWQRILPVRGAFSSFRIDGPPGGMGDRTSPSGLVGFFLPADQSGTDRQPQAAILGADSVESSKASACAW
ncbi:DDE-type integrase/transposase/recombinase [Mesobacterium pallidum]|uniref:DDE-type integrase/transposase/recombinase n=1 Tax=Mesobacterium pallidum TaxID=2872037 RepID=UPI002342FAD3|nr:DDE-type integrase/transposase/recombinase [Mesobacterium pallidum]